MGKRMTIDTHMAIRISDGEHEYLILLESYRRSLCILVMHAIIRRVKKYTKSKSKSLLTTSVNMLTCSYMHFHFILSYFHFFLIFVF